MDERVIEFLKSLGYYQVGTLSQGGNILRVTFFNRAGQSVELCDSTYWQPR